MKLLPKYPVIYEINTWVWLGELSRKYRIPVNLATVPSTGLRQAVIETLSDIAGQCDGLRCDMAMLVLNDIFERTWGARSGTKTEKGGLQPWLYSLSPGPGCCTRD